MAPMLATLCAALPPEGAVSPWGGPAARRATTLVASRTALPPDRDAFCSPGPAVRQNWLRGLCWSEEKALAKECTFANYRLDSAAQILVPWQVNIHG
jgi:hypothetical protein